MKITKAEARRFLVNYHGLNASRRNGKDAILNFIEKVGCIQYDPLNVVGRNSDLVLQARIKNYRPELLEELLYKDKSLIDAWDKMMSIYPTKNWAAMKRVRDAHLASVMRTMRKRGVEEALTLLDEVKSIVVDNGPLMAREISKGDAKRGRWGHGKLSSVALDYLYHSGDIAIHSKKGTQKVYDLMERTYAQHVDEDSFTDDHAFHKWYIKRRIASAGLLWNRNGGAWLGHFVSDKLIRNTIIKELVNKNEVVEVCVEGIEDYFYVRKEDICYFEDAITESDAMRILAPLDNMIWDRDMIEVLFDFNYRWEVYTPKDKRKYGYYVLPILYKDKFVGRFEPEKHKGDNPLVIKKWWWEDGVDLTDELKKSVEECLKEFCLYLGAEGISPESMERIFIGA